MEKAQSMKLKITSDFLQGQWNIASNNYYILGLNYLGKSYTVIIQKLLKP